MKTSLKCSAFLADVFRARWPVAVGLALVVAALGGCGPSAAGPAAAPTSAPAGQQTARVTGQVLYTDGRAVDQATVIAYEGRRDYLDLLGPPREIGRQRTTGDGKFSFAVRPGAYWVLVVAKKQGQAIGWGGQNLTRPGRPVKIELVQPAELSGHVVDEEGKPVAGAKVMVVLRRPGADRRSGRVGGQDQPEDLCTTTGADGKFAFDNLPNGASADFVVEADGHGRLNTRYDRGRRFSCPQTGIELKLPGEAKVEAAVADKDTGRPVGDVELILVPFGKDNVRLGEPVAGGKGRFRWVRVPPGRCAVELALPLHGPGGWAVKGDRIDAEAGETTKVKLEAIRGQIVEVAVRDAATGEPVKEAFVSAWSPKERWGAHGQSGDDGVVRLRAAPGEYKLGWARAPRYSAARPDKDFTVESGKPARVEVALEKAPRLHGVVRDPAGKPAPGTELSIVGDWGSAACALRN